MNNFQYTVAKCPLVGGSTSSDWWQALSRHHDFDCAEEALSKYTKLDRMVHRYMVFELGSVLPGMRFNIREIQKRHKGKNNVSN